ncbi:MAG TPA: hypothetical protein VGD12_01920 [Blastococcus sp.]
MRSTRSAVSWGIPARGAAVVVDVSSSMSPSPDRLAAPPVVVPHARA